MSYDDDDDDDDWEDDSDEAVLVRCPYCGEEMLEDAPRCPSCGNYISDEDRPADQKPRWILLTVVLCLLLALAWFVTW